jgi:hypothetical protein
MKNGYCCTTGCEFERETLGLFGCDLQRLLQPLVLLRFSNSQRFGFFGKREIIDQLCSLYLHCLVGFSSVDRREREGEAPLSWAASSVRLSVGQGLAFVFVLTV